MLDTIKACLIRQRKDILNELDYCENNLNWSNDKQYCSSMLNHIREIDENLKLIDRLNNK